MCSDGQRSVVPIARFGADSTYPYLPYTSNTVRSTVVIFYYDKASLIQVLSGATMRIRDGVPLIKEELDWSPGCP